VNGQQKTVDEMTSRELAATIKALKEAERVKTESGKLAQEQARKLQSASGALEAVRIKAVQLEAGEEVCGSSPPNPTRTNARRCKRLRRFFFCLQTPKLQ